MNKKPKPKHEGGITLISLIVMIILLVILAAVTIRGITGKERDTRCINRDYKNVHNRTIQRTGARTSKRDNIKRQYTSEKKQH